MHIGIVRGDYHWQESKQLLFEEDISVASTEKIELADLPHLPRIEYAMDPLMRMLIENWWSRTFSQPPLIGMEVDKGDTCREMVINGLGYGILSSALVEKDRDLHRITVRDEQGAPIVRQTWMFYRESALETKMVREFVRFADGLGVSAAPLTPARPYRSSTTRIRGPA